MSSSTETPNVGHTGDLSEPQMGELPHPSTDPLDPLTDRLRDAGISVSPLPPKPDAVPKNVAIVGFTGSREEAPWGADGWHVWVCNNLWKFVPDKWDRVYDVHPYVDIAASDDKDHLKFLAETDKHVVMMDPPDGWGRNVHLLPRDEITHALGGYFTNSISWMVAHALIEWRDAGYTPDECQLHIYGVDLAQAGEYAAQRPSCEYLLGIAVGMGVTVYVPPSSDLLKTGDLYGVGAGSPLRAKLVARKKELEQRMGQMQGQHTQLQQQIGQTEAALNQLAGAKEQVDYMLGVWLPDPGNVRQGQDIAASDGQRELQTVGG